MVKRQLGRVFEIKDLGLLKSFLGIEVARSKKGVVLSQQKCTLDLVKPTVKLGAELINTPMETNHHLSSGSSEFLDDPQY